jgi:hypothetical protein
VIEEMDTINLEKCPVAPCYFDILKVESKKEKSGRKVREANAPWGAFCDSGTKGEIPPVP